ncbi:hypothetical protein NX786_05770 [Telluria mixta]|uniref:Lipoprotein n=1 Tax=Telluria mixta TaxID=34071 RepID=A0ABT2BUM6_9BURK|nr:hypothetical protein [Telluria mixta]MCS0628835.1 hypothetical protein [Telluria mixta]WEM97290.1 hypothetical protein P0M04_06080 [Telluria mixta]
MKRSLLALCPAIALCGCQVMPDLSDTTNATMRFRVHYQAPGVGTPMVEVTTNTSAPANRCVYVNEPFGVSANVQDAGGVHSIVIGPSGYPLDRVKARNNPGDVIAIPGPADGTPPNPGLLDDTRVHVLYSTAKSFDTVTLFAVYEFRNATRAQMRATARNWGPTTGASEVYDFYVEKAQPSDPSRQPGMPCAVGNG